MIGDVALGLIVGMNHCLGVAAFAVAQRASQIRWQKEGRRSMKFRMAFVSNSSSSSFVLALEHKPIDVEEMQRWLFGNEDFFPNPYPPDDGPKSYPASEIAKRVFDDLQDKEPLSSEHITEELLSGTFEHRVLSEEIMELLCKKEDGTCDWDLFREMNTEEAKRVAEQFCERWPKRQYFVLTYSDHNGDVETACEHGDLFAMVPHLYINQH